LPGKVKPQGDFPIRMESLKFLGNPFF